MEAGRTVNSVAQPLEVRFLLSPPMLAYAGVAQLVERNLAMVEVASSRLVSRSNDSKLQTNASFSRKGIRNVGVPEWLKGAVCKTV